jgi:uncharacterized protein (TIGR03382 family)
MINSKLKFAMFAAAGLSLLPTAADAGIGTAQPAKMIASSPTNFAPITPPDTANMIPGRLRRTDENQPGNEMVHLAMFADGTHGLMFSMSTDLVDPANATISHKPTDRIQLAMLPFSLAKGADGTISAMGDWTGVTATGITNTATTGGARFVTNNNGNEYRNANTPHAYAIADGAAICAEYNYQPNNNTERYMQCFNTAGATVMPQTRIYAKTNDDCSMSQDSNSTWLINTAPKAGAPNSKISRMVAWRGCNGNGQDDGWLSAFSLTSTLDAAGKVTAVTFQQTTDVSLCPREERSRGYCTAAASDPSTAICTWTEGNTQPQRDGTWIGAVDLTKTGQASILWKQQLNGRKDITGVGRTYAQRAMHDRIMTVDPTTKALVASDLILYRDGDSRGNNNGNQKGGLYATLNVAVIKADKAGMTYVVPMTDLSGMLLGLDGTHLGMTAGLFGTTDNLQTGLTFQAGSQTGGGNGSHMRVVTWDKTTNTFADGGAFSGASFDRHLYPNYLGNNPGNQGRNFSGMDTIKNPFATGAAGEDAYLMITATSGKPSDELPSSTCLDCAKRKLAAYITVIPVAQTPANSGGSGSGSGSGSDNGNPDGTGGSTATDGSTDLGGCSTGGGAGGAMTFLLIGLAAFIRRRR